MSLKRRVKRASAALALLAWLGACSGVPDVPLNGVDMRRMDSQKYHDALRLPDHQGLPRQLKDFKNQIVILSFGYTHCPDFCPMTLAEHASLMNHLAKNAEQVQVLFVSIDPERDTPELLKQYVTAFHPKFLALRGSPAETLKVRQAFSVIAEKNGDGKHYSIDHSTGSYVFDKKGQLRVYFPYGLSVDKQLHDIQMLLNE